MRFFIFMFKIFYIKAIIVIYMIILGKGWRDDGFEA